MDTTAPRTALMAFCALLGVLLAALPVRAHHGTNVSYDSTKPLALTGTVTEWVFGNPHAQIYFEVKDASGKVVPWAGELNSPTNLRRDGWTKTTFAPGDQISLTVFPSRAGTAFGVVDRSSPVTVNGKVLPGRAGRGGDQQ